MITTLEQFRGEMLAIFDTIISGGTETPRSVIEQHNALMYDYMAWARHLLKNDTECKERGTRVAMILIETLEARSQRAQELKAQLLPPGLKAGSN